MLLMMLMLLQHKGALLLATPLGSKGKQRTAVVVLCSSMIGAKESNHFFISLLGLKWSQLRRVEKVEKMMMLVLILQHASVSWPCCCSRSFRSAWSASLSFSFFSFSLLIITRIQQSSSSSFPMLCAVSYSRRRRKKLVC